jgi:addiction module HigA family antidote
MEMKDPVHPGELIAEEVLQPLGLSVTGAARILGVGRQALSAVLNGRAKLSPDMAVRLEKAFGPKWEVLMRMQLQYDMAKMRPRVKDIKVKRYQTKAA